MAPGTEFTVRDDCKDEFLLCQSWPDFWVGHWPVSTGTVSNWTRTILKRMGCPPRGYAAHRRGCVTRALILNLLQNDMTEIDTPTMETITRWGGWEAVTGMRTVLKIYASKVMDL